MTEDSRTFTPADGAGMKNRTYGIDYFLDLMQKLKAADTDGNMKRGISDNIASALSKNPNLDVGHLERVLTIVSEHQRREVVKIILARKDRQKFMGPIFSAIESSKDSFTVYTLGTAILFDGGLGDCHARAMEALASLKDWRDYNVQLHEFLPGSSLSYQFFIRDMLKNAGSVDEAEKWLKEYDRLEGLFLIREDKVYCRPAEDPVKREKFLKRARDRARREMYQSLVSNRNLPPDYLWRFIGYADSIEDELFRTSYIGSFLSNPQITFEDCQGLFEVKRRQLRNKNLVNNLLGGLATNPKHFRIYFDYMARHRKKKMASPGFLFSWALLENPGLGNEELGRLLDAAAGIEYPPGKLQTRHILGRLGWSLVLLLRRPELGEAQHEKVRKEAIRFLKMIDGDEFYGLFTRIGRNHIYVDYLQDFHLLMLLSMVHLDETFVNYIFDYAARKDNGGLLVSGLLPNPGLGREWYDRAVRMLEEQYVDRDERFLISQRSTFCAEEVYKFWPASPYVK